MQFSFTLTETDYLQFAKFRNRLTKSGFMVYLLCAGILALGLYETMETKKYVYVTATGVMVLAVAALQLYSLHAAPKQQLKKRAEKDSLYTCENRLCIHDHALSVCIGQANGARIEAVYPFSAVGAVFETANAYYFFIYGTEIQMLPKRAIPDVQRDAVTERLKKLANYRFVK